MIREHDVFEETFGAIVDLQHGFFSLAFDKEQQWPEFCEVSTQCPLAMFEADSASETWMPPA